MWLVEKTFWSLRGFSLQTSLQMSIQMSIETVSDDKTRPDELARSRLSMSLNWEGSNRDGSNHDPTRKYFSLKQIYSELWISQLSVELAAETIYFLFSPSPSSNLSELRLSLLSFTMSSSNDTPTVHTTTAIAPTPDTNNRRHDQQFKCKLAKKCVAKPKSNRIKLCCVCKDVYIHHECSVKMCTANSVKLGYALDDGKEDEVICSKKCWNKNQKHIVQEKENKASSSNSKKRKCVPWATDGPNGADDTNNSLNVLVRIISDVDTSNTWREGNQFNGM